MSSNDAESQMLLWLAPNLKMIRCWSCSQTEYRCDGPPHHPFMTCNWFLCLTKKASNCYAWTLNSYYNLLWTISTIIPVSVGTGVKVVPWFRCCAREQSYFHPFDVVYFPLHFWCLAYLAGCWLIVRFQLLLHGPRPPNQTYHLPSTNHWWIPSFLLNA